MTKIALGLLWLGFSAYAFLLTPPTQPDTLNLIVDLSTGNWAGINPLIVSLFNVMGVLPLMYACFLFIDGRSQRLPAWLFVAASMGVGAFSVLPYLVLRGAAPKFSGTKNGFLKLWDSRWTGAILSSGAIGLVLVGLATGNWSDFVQQWQTNRFIHVMSLDFCLLCLLFPALLRDDMARRGLKDDRIFWGVALLPLVGAAAYLSLRPPTREEFSATEAMSS